MIEDARVGLGQGLEDRLGLLLLGQGLIGSAGVR